MRGPWCRSFLRPGGLICGAAAIRSKARIPGISGDWKEQEKHHFLTISLSFLDR
jgi:hypothetical protein